MKRVKRYFLNAILMSAASVLMQSVTVSFNIYVSNRIGAEGMGLLTLIFTVTGLSVTVATSGIQLAVVKMVAEAVPYGEDGQTGGRRARSIVRAALAYSLFFGTLAAALLFFLARPLALHAIGDARSLPSLRIYALSLPFIAVSAALNGYFSGVRRVHKNVLAKVGEQAVKIALTSALLILLAPAGAAYACAAAVAGGAVSEAASLLFYALLYLHDRKKTGIGGRAPSEAEKSALRPLVSIAFPVVLSTYARSALLTVEHLAIPWGLKQYGISASGALASYGILHGMVFPLLLFPSAVLSSFSGLLIPEIAEGHAAGMGRRIEYITGRMFQVSLIFSIGVAGIFVCYSHEIGTVLYGSTEAAEHIRVLAPLIPLMYLDGAVDSILKGMGEQLYSMKVNITDSLTGIIMVVILLPVMGIRGYRLVIFVCETLNATLSIIKLLEVTRLKADPLRWLGKPLLAAVGATLIVRPLSDSSLALSLFSDARSQLFAAIVGTSLLYLALVLILGGISREDLRWGKRLLSRKE